MNQYVFNYDTTTRSVNDTIKLGELLGTYLDKGDVLLLSGDLGAGKTVFTKGVVAGLGSKDIARSPTFVIVAEYAARIPIYHMDLYRLSESSMFDNMFLEEYIYGDGLCIVEWPNQISGMFPEYSLRIQIDLIDDLSRKINIQGSNIRHNDFFMKLKEN
ncbi:MAG: tRNA (adenosine(37)-N6)-threonylcarbamoyltransferase complex ATPase subunit type 1 TsaE [Dehalococcoidia bacterium]|jgi:tRNA threonylcarbamoyladenosine biosynthesis protein TsaE|tara:strand:- start:1862 stop:2338 length:477 start_codon:yes stop_codon:yes gene_type:complete